MKQVSSRQVAMSFTGVFLGAGFVSGQELWQFFACFGPIGLLGFVGTAALFYLVFYSCMRLVQVTGSQDMGRMLTPGDRPWLRLAVSTMQSVELFGVTVIMIAGAASLLHQLVHWPLWLAGLVFTAAVSAVALLGIQGLVAVFSALVPITTAAAVLLAGATLVKGGFSFPPPNGSVSPLMPNWIVGFITYAAYNLLGTIAVIVPLAKLAPDAGTIRRGLGMGSGLLIVLAWSMIAALAARPSAGLEELPMAVLAGELHPVLEAGYGLLMGLGMFSAAIAAMSAVVGQLAVRRGKDAFPTKRVTLVLLAAAWLLSMAGFGNLVGILYPIFGYLGIPFLVCLVINWFREKKKLPSA